MVVMIVEDEAIIAYCSASMLEEAGHTVLGPAHTSSQALELARTIRPDVALVDIDLEVAGAGIDVARELRAQPGTAIVYTTGCIDAACIDSDTAVMTLAKPFDPAELPRIVELAASLYRVPASCAWRDEARDERDGSMRAPISAR